MKELLNDEKLTTADLVNPARPAAEVHETSIPETDTPSSSDRFPVDRVAVDHVASDRVLETRDPLSTVLDQPAQHNPLFPQDELQSLRSHWATVQTSFVDEPRTAVEHADSLVAKLGMRIAEQFASEREQLEKQWDRGEDVNTEDLRQALKRYRAFFDRLLAF
jgi:hypothetical protein